MLLSENCLRQIEDMIAGPAPLIRMMFIFIDQAWILLAFPEDFVALYHYRLQFL